MRPLHVGSAVVQAEVVNTEAARERGLSGRSDLAPNTGMLFEFGTDSQWGIWMKDMNFSIDIVWMAADGTVVYMVPNAAPDTYPTVFAPPTLARYVLELPAGYLTAHGVAIGTKIVL